MTKITKDTESNNGSLVSAVMYRLSQFIAFLYSIHIFSIIILILALYVSTLFLFSKVDSIKDFIFDYKVHGIIFSAIISVLAGRVINQFYDREKDTIAKPFSAKIQQFLKQKYYLYSYILFNILSLFIAISVSYRVLIFFLIYQFFMWFYSHKLSKILFINNLTFVSLTLYPFFGVLVYYKSFSIEIFYLAIYLFLILWALDIVKDFLTKNVDKVFGYQTIPNYFNAKIAKGFLISLFILLTIDSVFIINSLEHSIISIYYLLTGFLALVCIILALKSMKYKWIIILNLLRLWIFIGIIFMIIEGVLFYFHY